VKISSFLHEDHILIGIKHKRKSDIFKELLAPLVADHTLPQTDLTSITAALVDREKLGSTAIGQGIAIPHARIEGIAQPIMAVGVSADGIDFDSLDGAPVKLVFLILSPKHEAGTHLKLLASISKLLRDLMFVDKLTKVKGGQEFCAMVAKRETA
jgi:PTS system nitrogen regulatory IIA component